uniref:Cystatin fetuin-B-type domain-containing protein n=1 Tax=Periophthalmus magnuspinnatus TaxID=409849 RepID=A0A3B3ZNH2_9GOBI
MRTYGVVSKALDMMPIELAPIPCNDKAVEKLSRLAMTYINEDRSEGYKFALNRITNVHLHAQGPAGNVYYLDLDVLETKCHIGSPKPWKRCDVRPFMETQISGNCNTTILHTQEGYSYLYSYDCTLVPDPPEKLQQTCPTCPLLLPIDSPQAVTAAQVTLDSYKRKSLLGAGLGVKKILRAAQQVTHIWNAITSSLDELHLTGANAVGFCSGSVHGDVRTHPEVHVSCEMFKVQVHLPSDPLTSSSSESFEILVPRPALPGGPVPPAGPVHMASSSEEFGVPLARRPPHNFWYKKRDDRRRRQALPLTQSTHTPVFLTDFPDGSSPFRSCPGPSRYTTV